MQYPFGQLGSPVPVSCPPPPTRLGEQSGKKEEQKIILMDFLGRGNVRSRKGLDTVQALLSDSQNAGVLTPFRSQIQTIAT